MINIISVPPELVEQWVDLLESHSDQAVFTLAAHWGYTQAVKELEEFLKKTVDTPCNNSMTDQHPITPPPELVQQWQEDWYRSKVKHTEYESYFATRAAQWGADQELEACCEWLEDVDCDDPQDTAKKLRAARRPKPPSLKEQALALLEVEHGLNVEDLDLLRRALEQLDD